MTIPSPGVLHSVIILLTTNEAKFEVKAIFCSRPIKMIKPKMQASEHTSPSLGHLTSPSFLCGFVENI